MLHNAAKRAAAAAPRSAYDCVVPAHGKALVKTDLAIKVPSGTYGRVAPRSGLAWKNFIDTGAGVIDEDYRGNVGVILFNHSDQDFQSEQRQGRVTRSCRGVVGGAVRLGVGW